MKVLFYGLFLCGSTLVFKVPVTWTSKVLREKVIYCFEPPYQKFMPCHWRSILEYVTLSNSQTRNKISIFDSWTRRRLDLTDQISSGEWTNMNLCIFSLVILLEIDQVRRTIFDEIHHLFLVG